MARENKQKRHERRFGKAERLADSIITARGLEDWRLPSFAYDDFADPRLDLYKREAIALQGDLAAAAIFDASGVCDIYWHHERDVWDIERDFPSLLPPFPSFWIEASQPDVIFENGQSQRPSEWMPQKWGFYFESISHGGELPQPNRTGEPGCDSLHFDNLAHVYAITMAMRDHHGGLTFFPAKGWLGVDDKGNPVAQPMFMIPGDTPLIRDGASEFVGVLLKPILLALSFLNCRNVTTTLREPPADINRARTKAGLKPFVRYHTIDIEPMRNVLKTEGGIEANGLKKALHICRGHFAVYREKMFGRTLAEPVTVWRPAHVRGSLDKGVVVSDYRVHPPKAG